MGVTYKSFTVKQNHEAKKKIHVNFLIDSGAVYSLVPEKELKKLNIKPHKKMDFILADGTKMVRRLGGAYFEYKGEGGLAPVIFGEEGDEPLLGTTTFESIGLVLNPFKRELYPMRMLMCKATKGRL